MSTVFLETSALGRVLFGEEGGESVNDRLRQASRIVASRLLRIEIERALLRHALDDPDFEKQVPKLERELRDLWARVTFIELTRGICDDAGRIAPRARLRTLDAIHLATYRRLLHADPAIEMLTHDSRLLETI